MIDELDLSQEVRWYYEQRGKITVSNFQKRNINALFVPSRSEALTVIMNLIPAGVVVGRGDSLTMEQLEVIEELEKRNQNRFIDPFKLDASGHGLELRERRKLQREALLADIFLTGANAVTLDGKLVSTDGSGNRVAATIFGPAKVIFAVGANKIVRDLEAALERVHTVAAPINARRHYAKHNAERFGNLPCVKTGRCADCFNEARICNYTVIIEGCSAPDKGRLNVVVVGEDLGI